MPLYWTKKSVPELASLSKEERERVWNATRWNAFQHWQMWLAVAVVAVIFWLLPDLFEVLEDRGWSKAARMVVAGFLGGGTIAGSNLVAVAMRRPHMRAEIESQQSGQDGGG